MSYQALYRTYRPKSFDEVKGQEHVVKTLKNAIKTNKVAHAYLFCGPRGTGKTTIAKIFAKAINCLGDNKPCNNCEICNEINSGKSLDIIEMDAASNNGVDEIRDIVDKVKYLPATCTYKVYIIDEVHMLSTQAFNALLKTLEEPPAHVIFILATTEPHKILPTILSRCQRFDFKGIDTLEIVKRLDEVAKLEGISITKEAINMIAIAAEGGMRDALSMLDKAISYTEDTIKDDDVSKITGMVSNANLLKLIEYIFNKDTVNSINTLNNLLKDGKEVARIINDMILFLRNMLIFRNVSLNSYDLEIFKDDDFKNLATKLTNQKIYFYINILNDALNSIKWTNNKRTYIELALIKMCDHTEIKGVDYLDKIEALENKIEMLENKIKNVSLEPKKAVVKKDVVDASNIIERVLWNRNDNKRDLLNKAWPKLKNYPEFNLAATAKMLSIGNLEVMNDNEMVLVYDDESLAIRMNQEMNKKQVKEILNKKSELVEDYIAISKAKWDNIYNDYLAKKESGIEAPNVAKVDVEIKMAKKEAEIITDAKEFFGNDINIKEE